VMIRAIGFLAALFSLALSVLLFLRLRHERYAGPIHQVTATEFIVDVLEGPEQMSEDWTVRGIYGLPLPQPPSTMRGELSGTQSSKFVFLTIPAPPAVLDHVVKNAPAEVKHVYFDLPAVGPVLGATSYVIGSYEWREPRWRLYGFIGAIALAPLFLWGLGATIALLAGAKVTVRPNGPA
jgi:hypothetical protein